MSGLADLSVSDGDPNIFAASVHGSDQAKHGRVFVRTRAGERAMALADSHHLLASEPVELRGLNLGLERKRNRRASYERMDKPIPVGPIPGHIEDIEIIPDERWIAVPSSTEDTGSGEGR
jgi:coenzyme F420 hydrogenase subunit beta